MIDDSKNDRVPPQDTEALNALAQAGLTQALKQFLTEAPEFLELQRALLKGANQSHLREEEYWKKEGDDDRATASKQRANGFEQLAQQINRTLDYAQKGFMTTTQPGLFHGYVVHQDGEPAAGYTVQLRPQQEAASADAKCDQSKKPTTQTDAQGYFRFQLGKKDFASTTERIKLSEKRAGNRMEPGVFQVQIFNEKGDVVLEDPLPPDLSGGRSDIRYYTLEKS